MDKGGVPECLQTMRGTPGMLHTMNCFKLWCPQHRASPSAPKRCSKRSGWRRWGEALAPDIYPLVVAPLEFHIFLGVDPSWDEKLDKHARFYERLRARRVECDAAYDKLANIRVEPSSVRPKHWPLPGETTDDTRQRVLASNPVESCFFRGVTPELLTVALMEGMFEHVDDLWPPPPHAFFDLCAMTVVGCSGQGDTKFIRFDCSFDPPSAHAYPVDESELGPRVMVSSLLVGRVDI